MPIKRKKNRRQRERAIRYALFYLTSAHVQNNTHRLGLLGRQDLDQAICWLRTAGA